MDVFCELFVQKWPRYIQSALSSRSRNELAPVNYQILVDGLQADPAFIQPPDDSQLNDRLGMDVCGCNPRRCKSFFGIRADRSDVLDKLTQAYLEANPTLTRDDFDIEITRFANANVNG